MHDNSSINIWHYETLISDMQSMFLGWSKNTRKRLRLRQSQHLPSFAMGSVENRKYSRGVEGREEPCFMSAVPPCWKVHSWNKPLSAPLPPWNISCFIFNLSQKRGGTGFGCVRRNLFLTAIFWFFERLHINNGRQCKNTVNSCLLELQSLPVPSRLVSS